MRRTLLLVVPLLVAACAAGPTGSPPPDIAGEWVLADGVLPPRNGSATLVVAEAAVSGVSFCNHYTGNLRWAGDSLSVEGLGGTDMGCEPDVMAAETAYLAALGSVAQAAVEDGDLVLRGNDVHLRFAPVEPVPDSELAGTRWLLDTLVQGETASSTVGGAPAVLVLAPDGTASASTGCRTVTGRWLVEHGALVVDDLLADGAGCPPDVERQDALVTAVLSSAARVEITEDRLTLTGPDAQGLIYRAQ